MFCLANAKKFCKLKNIPLIEGYAEAVSSPEKYVIHHRNEIQPDGVVCSRKWLIDHHIYFGREPHELIFMKDSDHRKLHSDTYWCSDDYASTRVNAKAKMKRTKTATKEQRSERMKSLWNDKHQMMCSSMKAGHTNSTYNKLYGMTRAELAASYGITEWRVQELHRKGELYAFIRGV